MYSCNCDGEGFVLISSDSVMALCLKKKTQTGSGGSRSDDIMIAEVGVIEIDTASCKTEERNKHTHRFKALLMFSCYAVFF